MIHVEEVVRVIARLDLRQPLAGFAGVSRRQVRRTFRPKEVDVHPGRLVRQAVQQQLEEFGRSRFQKEFVLLRDVQGSPQSDLKGAKLRDYLWRNLPSSPFKRMQEIFVAPEDIVTISPRLGFSAATKKLWNIICRI